MSGEAAFHASKLLPGSIDCSFYYNNQPLSLPVKHNRGSYTVSYPGAAGTYYVYFYCVGAGANHPTRKAWFVAADTTSVGTSYTYAGLNASPSNLGHATFYSGDFNLFSSTGLVYAADLSFRFRAPSATQAAAMFSGQLTMAQLSTGITLA